jgi:hypothetical protein
MWQAGSKAEAEPAKGTLGKTKAEEKRDNQKFV